ncbi:MAG: 5-(carboxyamino)imidazole ribonucleotide mutase [Methanohalobium sp.]|uniref:5-(carboxyamino)imidazole ribonucleotide mutase n=1 Tax=Methanohalobium sp. TaxID=2837493 RepID=UPI00397C425C
MVDVAIISGSDSDKDIAEKATKVLDETEYNYDVQVISAHRNPDKLDEYVTSSDAKVFITIAGLSAALPGVVASKTEKPVIGVPVNAKLGGLDALLSTVQMPPGVPVATVGIDNGKNAANLAIRILNLLK